MAQENGTSSAVREFGMKTRRPTRGSPMERNKRPIRRRSCFGSTSSSGPVLEDGQGSFDKNYMTEAVNDHNEAVRLYQQESESGKIASSLKALAASIHPTCRSI
jgi:hypothetical protein